MKRNTGGTDALGEVLVSLEEGPDCKGHGADTGIIVASAKAYINALNKMEIRKNEAKTIMKILLVYPNCPDTFWSFK